MTLFPASGRFGARWGGRWCYQACASVAARSSLPCSRSAWKLATRTETERLNHSVGPGGGKGWEWKEGGGKRHPTLPCLEPLFTGAFLCRARGGGQELKPQTGGQSSGGSAGRKHPLHPGQGCPITGEEWGLSPMGHSHLGRGVPARRGVAGDTRELMSGKRWHRSPGDKGLRIFPTAGRGWCWTSALL